uniref:Uncharacterized protein n=1 Tax=Rhipicephalus zambeziensis TaxID=60191 RepID=A0A224YFW6_9ACAR
MAEAPRSGSPLLFKKTFQPTVQQHKRQRTRTEESEAARLSWQQEGPPRGRAHSLSHAAPTPATPHHPRCPSQEKGHHSRRDHPLAFGAAQTSVPQVSLSCSP